MKKIIFITQYYPPDISPAGYRIKSFVDITSKNNNFYVYVITTIPHYRKVNKNYKYFEKTDKYEIIRFKLMRSDKIYKKFLNEFIFFIKSVFIVLIKIKNFDLIVASSPPLLTGFSGFIISKFKKKKYIIDIRDLWLDLAIELKQIRNKIIILLLTYIEKITLKNAEFIICTTNGFKEIILNKINKNKKIITIYNGIDDVDLKVAENINLMRHNLGFKKEDFIITYIGNIGLPQGLSTLIDCIKFLKNIKFVLIGDGGEKPLIQKRKLEEEIDNLILLPTISRDKVKFYYYISNALLVHLRKSKVLNLTIPSKIFEYLCTDLPILYGLEGEAKKLLEKFPGCIYFEQENCKSLLNSINFLINSYDFIKKGINNRKENVMKIYSREKFAKDFINEINFILNI